MALTAEERKYWEDKGFVKGAKVRATGLSWNESISSRKWVLWEGTIVKGTRPKTKGIPVEFVRVGHHFPEIFVYHPTNLELIETPKATKEPKMPEPKETKSPLYTAVRDILEAKDRETLDARTDAKVSAVLGVLGDEFAFVRDPQAVNITNIVAPAPATPWSLDGLVIDPGEEAVGQWGWFWDDEAADLDVFGILMCVRTNLDCPFQMGSGSCWAHFVAVPRMDGEALIQHLKAVPAKDF